MSNDHFKHWVFIKAGETFTSVTKWMGFDTIESAFTQGFYAGYNKALEDVENEITAEGGGDEVQPPS